MSERVVKTRTRRTRKDARHDLVLLKTRSKSNATRAGKHVNVGFGCLQRSFAFVANHFDARTMRRRICVRHLARARSWNNFAARKGVASDVHERKHSRYNLVFQYRSASSICCCRRLISILILIVIVIEILTRLMRAQSKRHKTRAKNAQQKPTRPHLSCLFVCFVCVCFNVLICNLFNTKHKQN
jgi:hypothetical protein